jgi:hypothetical protein
MHVWKVEGTTLEGSATTTGGVGVRGRGANAGQWAALQKLQTASRVLGYFTALRIQNLTMIAPNGRKDHPGTDAQVYVYSNDSLGSAARRARDAAMRTRTGRPSARLDSAAANHGAVRGKR